MKQWYDKIHQIYTYNPNSKGVDDYYDNIKLSGNLSPLTNLFLNTFIETINQKNIIINIPHVILKSIPLISYIYSHLEHKSTLIFTQNGQSVLIDPKRIHSRNYYLLNYDDSDYLFRDIPIGLLSKEGLEDPDVFLPRAKNNHLKREYIDQQEANYFKGDKPKILLYYDETATKITETLENIVSNKSEKKRIDIDIGCIIFENVDRFVRSKIMADSFLNWINTLLEKKINIIFHFTNPNSIFIEQFRKATNSLVLPCNFSLLKNNDEIKKASKDYFKKKNKIEMEYIAKYNIDNPNFFDDENNKIEIYEPILKSGNLDHYFKDISYLRTKVNEKKIINKKLYFKVLRLIYSLPNLTVNPSIYQFPYLHYDNPGWYTVDTIIQKFSDELIKNDNNKLFLESLVSNFYSIYFELTECDRYYERGSYDRIAKDYALLELAKNNEIFQEAEKTIFVTYRPYERSIFENEMNRLKLEYSFEVFDIYKLNKTYFDRSNSTLILPGPLPTPYLSELLFPYKKILFLTYGGYNYERTVEQANLFFNYSFELENNSMIYLKELYDFLKISKNNSLFRDFKKRKEIENLKNTSFTEQAISKPENNVINPFDKVKEKMMNYRHSRDYQTQIDYIERNIAQINKDAENEINTEEYIEVILKELNDNSDILNKKLPLGKSYFYLRNIGGEVEQGTPQNFRPGYFVVILDGDEQKTLLQLIIEIFNLEKSVNKILIEYWKEKLMKFINENKITYKELYNLYVNAGGQKTYQSILHWAKGSVIGPRDPMDLFYIGKLTNDDIILENYEIMEKEIEKVRKIHISTGKRLQKIIKEVIFEGTLKIEEITYEEYLFYEKVKNGIYEIIEIKR